MRAFSVVKRPSMVVARLFSIQFPSRYFFPHQIHVGYSTVEALAIEGADFNLGATLSQLPCLGV